jgi:hypothetical protein
MALWLQAQGNTMVLIALGKSRTLVVTGKANFSVV